jgi:hypothetical protein
MLLMANCQAKVYEYARHRGISPDILLNLWLQEKIQEQNA